MKHPDMQSKRSKRRANRGFKSLELSSRKHRRADRRSYCLCTVGNKTYPPGTKFDPETPGKDSTYLHTAGGSRRYH